MVDEMKMDEMKMDEIKCIPFVMVLYTQKCI